MNVNYDQAKGTCTIHPDKETTITFRNTSQGVDLSNWPTAHVIGSMLTEKGINVLEPAGRGDTYAGSNLPRSGTRFENPRGGG